MQRKKNIQLFFIFLGLLAWTIIFVNLGERKKRVSVQEDLFAIQDTAAVRKINITSPDKNIILEEIDGNWMVNGQYTLDPSMKTVLMAVLHQVRVKRTVPKNRLENISEKLVNNGNLVQVIFKNGTERSFLTGGNGISVSYFMNPDDAPYIVYLPGYESYVSGIFDVSENDWRDRLIFQTSWMGLRSLSIVYPDSPSENVVVEPEGNLYRVENISQLDTVALMDFIDKISYFYTDQYIDHGRIPEYDSLARTIPNTIFTVDAISLENPLEIKFYESLPNESVRLGVVNNEEFCLFRKNRIEFLFKTRSDFSKND